MAGTDDKHVVGLIHAWNKTYNSAGIGDVDNSLKTSIEPYPSLDALDLQSFATDFIDDWTPCLRLLRYQMEPLLLDVEKIDDIADVLYSTVTTPVDAI